MTDSIPILAYWDIRGLAAPIRFNKSQENWFHIFFRLMLAYGDVSYENRTMIMPKPDWLKFKHSLGFDFPNLPYYQVTSISLHLFNL